MEGRPPLITPGPPFPGRPLGSLRLPVVLFALRLLGGGDRGAPGAGHASPVSALGFAAGEHRDFHKRTGSRATDELAAFHTLRSSILPTPRSEGAPTRPKLRRELRGAVPRHPSRATAESPGELRRWQSRPANTPASAPLGVCPRIPE